MAAPFGKQIFPIFTRKFALLRRLQLGSSVACRPVYYSRNCAAYPASQSRDNSIFQQRQQRGHNYDQDAEVKNNAILFGAVAFSLFGFGKKEEINEFNLFVAQARIAEEKLQLVECDKLYHDALHVLEDQLRAKIVTETEFIEKQTVVFNSLANVCLLQGKVRLGEELMKATLQGLFACGREQSDNAVLEISLKLANIFALQKREAEAIAGYRFCYKTLNEKIENGEKDEDTQALLGLTCDNYGRYLLSLRDYIQAEHFFLKALKICRDLNGNSHPQSLLIMNNLATLGVARKDYKKSREHLETAVKLSKDSKDQNVDILAAVYCNLAMVYLHEGMKSESFLALKEAESLAKMTQNEELLKEIEECRKKIDT